MTVELATLAAHPERIADVGPEALPGLIGELEGLKAALWVRLQVAGAPARPAPTPRPGSTPDRLLTAEEAGARLGVGRRWMYRHASELPFVRRLTSGTLRFSERGLERWQEARK